MEILEHVVDILLSVFVAVVAVIIAVALWKALYGADKAALNQYRLFGDMMEGVLENPGVAVERKFTFAANIGDDRDAYKGTIFAVSSGKEGERFYTAPFPPIHWYATAGKGEYAGAAAINRYVIEVLKKDPKRVRKVCGAQACLCFTKKVVKEADDLAAIDKLYECRALKDPEDRPVVISQFVTYQDWEEWHGAFPQVVIKKGGCESAEHALRAAGKTLPEDAVCLYVKLAPPPGRAATGMTS